MTQLKKQIELNNFSGGLNTEQSPLNADPATTMQEQNMILASDGSRARRFGYNTAEEAALLAPVREGARLSPPVYNYRKANINVGGLTFETRDFTLLQDFTPLTSSFAYRVYENSNTAINTVATSLPTNTLGVGVADYSATASQIGASLVIPQGTKVLAVTPDESSKLKGRIMELFVRDLWGLDSGISSVTRPATLTVEHAYNLINQGWTAERIIKFRTEVEAFPSNGDVYYYGMVPTSASDTSLKYDKETLKKVPFPGGAPKGQLRISTASPDGTRSSNRYAGDQLLALSDQYSYDWVITEDSFGNYDIEAIPSISSSNFNITACTAYLGRMFYSGYVEGQDVYADGTALALGSLSPSFNNAIIFSKVVDSSSPQTEDYTFIDFVDDVDNPFMCHSKISPTDENFSPSPTDGGIVFVSGADRILGTTTTRNSLLIIATNGVWELQANDGFSPSTFTLFKILEASIISTEGVVTVSDTVMIPTSTGIYAMAYDGNSRRTVSQNISDKFVRTYYLGKYNWIADSVYDEARQEVRWLLTTPPVYTNGTDIVPVQQEELVLDVRLGSFSINKFPDTLAVVKDRPTAFEFRRLHYVRPPNASIQFPWQFVCRYLKLPQPSIPTDAKTPIDVKRRSKHVKLLVADYYQESTIFPNPLYTIYETTVGSFSDFGRDPVPAFMVTNPVTMGDTIRRKDMPYIWTHFYRTEDGFEDDGTGNWIPTNQSGCLMSARWDFSDDVISGKWTTPQQVYRLQREYMPEDIDDPFTYGHSIITTKNNIRGAGKAISLKFESDGNKDMQLIGWGAEVAINGGV